MKKTLIAWTLALSVIFVPGSLVFADGESGGISGGETSNSPTVVSVKIDNPIEANNFSEFAAMITKAAVQILLPFVVLAFMYSGFLFIRAQGNEAQLEEAKKAIWYSMIGAFILLGAWSFAQIIGRTVSTLTQ